jgi:hypothetical protein
MIRLAVAGFSVLAIASAWAGTGKHVPLLDCGDIWYGVDYDPPPPRSLDDLGPKVRAKLNAYLVQRLSGEYSSKLSLVGGQVIDRNELREKVPQSADYKWRPPKYNLHFSFPVAADPNGLCVSVKLDEDGSVLEPIGLPNFVLHPERSAIASTAEADGIAKRNGVPIDKAIRRLYYFPDTETIEYDFEFVKHDDGLNIVYSHFHVLAHDTTKIHWRESSAMR